MLMDCAALKWDTRQIVRGMDEGRFTYDQLVWDLCIVPPGCAKPDLPFEWNSLEHYEEGRTHILHYTDMPTQPWTTIANSNAGLWFTALREALQSGFIEESFVREEVAKGHVHAHLPWWIGLDPAPPAPPPPPVPAVPPVPPAPLVLSRIAARMRGRA